MKESPSIQSLIHAEGWEIIKENNQHFITVYGQLYPVVHPLAIHLKIYRTHFSPEIKYQHLLAAHNILWPKLIKSWSYWDERRFRTHCEDWKYISYAGGASTGKSHCAARLALLFWLANPKKRIVIVASTTLESLNSRIFGYCTSLISETAVPVTHHYYRGNAPKIMYDNTQSIHGIFAISAKQGDDERTISSWIGRHSEDGIMVVLDEGSDMPIQLNKALPNLEAGASTFQCIVIANSCSKFDLHGAMSTPKNGWNSVDPMKTTHWETTQNKGICLYFGAFESPAIHESDPTKKAILSKFLITDKQIKEKEYIYGKDSDAFYRFVLGFWKSSSTESTVMTKEFLKPFNIYTKAHWLGAEPLQIVAGLDVAFSTGGDQCLLQIGYLGQTVNGDIVLDFRGNDLLFKIHISAKSGKGIELQIAEQVQKILDQYGCPLANVAVDATGQGRAIGGTLQLQMGSGRAPIKILTTRTGGEAKNSFDVVLKTRHELWFDFRKFIENGNIKGVNEIAAAQFASRMVLRNPKTMKEELETKLEYKKRMGAIMPSLAHSPDEADVETLCLQSAIINFGFHPGQKREVPNVPVGQMEEIIAWKNKVHMVQQEHMEPKREYPKAEFKGGLEGVKPFGSF